VFTFDTNNYSSYLYVNILSCFDSLLNKAGYDESVIWDTFKKMVEDEALEYLKGESSDERVDPEFEAKNYKLSHRHKRIK
jgi:hypothetical protein